MCSSGELGPGQPLAPSSDCQHVAVIQALLVAQAPKHDAVPLVLLGAVSCDPAGSITSAGLPGEEHPQSCTAELSLRGWGLFQHTQPGRMLIYRPGFANKVLRQAAQETRSAASKPGLAEHILGAGAVLGGPAGHLSGDQPGVGFTVVDAQGRILQTWASACT